MLMLQLDIYYHRTFMLQLLHFPCLFLFSLTLANCVSTCPLISRNYLHNLNYVKITGSVLFLSFVCCCADFVLSASPPAGQRKWPAEAELAALASSISPLSHVILFHCVATQIVVLPLLL